ncbi:hypothetical protein QCA50_016924 [Cerrena zonata]|uniref:F-box domain-containing protein n=1 Tax=Cerrena zonata TaxID=2478898 RepID=A0AAW0FG50_9APHY
MITLHQRLLFHILNHLSWRDLLTCSQVCKTLERLVNGVPSLRYRIELEATGMTDNEFHPWSPREKLARLRRYEQAWADFFPSKVSKSVIPLSEETGWEWYGGILATTLGDHTVHFFQPGSRTRAIPRKSWILDFALSVGTMHMDTYQELIILTFFEEERNFLHLIDIHTGRKHPLANMVKIPLPAPLHATYDIQTWGHKVAMLIRWLDGNTRRSRIAVWDWQLGIPIIMHESEFDRDETTDRYVDYTAHVFLDDDRLLLSCCDYVDGNGFRNGRIVVLDLTKGNKAFQHILSFRVPLAADGFSLVDMVIARNCPSTHSSKNVAFQTSQVTAAIAIRCVYQEQTLGLTQDILIFTPSGIFSSLCDKFVSPQTTSVDWNLWGPKNTRAFDNTDLTYFVLFGSHFLLVQDHSVMLYDLNHRGALSNITLSLTNCVGEDDNPTELSLATSFTSPTTIQSQMLKEELITSLPYRVLSTGLTDEKGIEMVISEDNIAINNNDEMFIIYSI